MVSHIRHPKRTCPDDYYLAAETTLLHRRHCSSKIFIRQSFHMIRARAFALLRKRNSAHLTDIPCRPARTALYALAALIVQGIPTHPDHTATTLSKIVRNLLADVAKTLKGSPARSTVHHKNDESSRKAKKSRLFETDQALSPKITISSDDATLVNHALRCRSRGHYAVQLSKSSCCYTQRCTLFSLSLRACSNLIPLISLCAFFCPSACLQCFSSLLCLLRHHILRCYRP